MGCINSKSTLTKTNRIILPKFWNKDITGSQEDKTCIPLFNKYVSLYPLGLGSYSKVLAAKDISSQQIVAIKTIKKYRIHQPAENVPRVLTEPIILNRLSHIRILTYINTHQDDYCYYIVTEYCKGGSLYDYLVEKIRVDEKILSFLMCQILEGVAYMHSKGYIHRDLKLENILFVTSDKDSIKIADFGHACEIPKEPNSAPSKTLFMSAPEVFTGIYNEKIDIWSCGIIALTLFTGKVCCLGKAGDSFSRLYEKLLEEFQGTEKMRDFIRKALDVDWKKRLSAKEALAHPWVCRC